VAENHLAFSRHRCLVLCTRGNIEGIVLMRLGVNIDHVATLRQARKGDFPDPVMAARICEDAGADSIVVHLREDRRHIQDSDVKRLRSTIRTRLNLEMAIATDIVRVACSLKPDQSTLVPERRMELTTEGGLDVVKNSARLKDTVAKLQSHAIEVSLFIDPERKQIDAAYETGAQGVEFHTGSYADARNRKTHIRLITDAAYYAQSRGFRVAAGHGLDYANAADITAIEPIEELNIGYSIICRALLTGLYQAVRDMKGYIQKRGKS
jgi:pyridoxine 5-phosphate synthase